MRVMMKAELDTEKTNDLIRNGKMPQIVQEAMEHIHPESSYFTVDEGQRTMFFVFDMQDTSTMPAIAEPFFMQMGAKIDYTPVMNLDDLQRGLAELR
ncbi:DUF3303 family protein [Streptomyces sp. NPDC048751]|uniref:DUF3303 family protein n=1 Tax=Streptomyces sp. NPDC048751 TaxID=3365591 RepID=UPI003713F2AA